MIDLVEGFMWAVPNMKQALILLLWLCAAIVFSVLFNHQTLENKKLNTYKVLGFSVISCSLTMFSQYANNDSERFGHAVALTTIVAALLIGGDWIGFAINRAAAHDGGIQGLVWGGIARAFRGLSAMADRRAEQSANTDVRLLTERIRRRGLGASPDKPQIKAASKQARP